MKRSNIVLCSFIFLLGLFGFQLFPVFAIAGQWSSNGGLIYYNEGNVSIGTNTSWSNLSVMGKMSIRDNGPIPTGDSLMTVRTYNYNPQPNSNIFVAGITGGSDWERLVLKSDGNFGINHNAPWKPLSVRGEVEIRDKTAMTSNTTLFQVRAYYYNADPNSNLMVLGTTGGSGWEKFIVKTNGNAYLSGTLKVKELQVKSNVWADYVFEDSYKLMSLPQLASYIKENKHLPNIPSQKEIEKNGISVGDMQRLQMEKIEELTLHLIEKDREIKNLQERLERLESLIVK